MQIIIVTCGSRGDAQPYTTLGIRRQHAGDYRYGPGKKRLVNAATTFDVVKRNIELAKQVKPQQIDQLLESWASHGRRWPRYPSSQPASGHPFPMLPDLRLGSWCNCLSRRIITSLMEIFPGKHIVVKGYSLPECRRLLTPCLSVGATIFSTP